MNKTLHQFDRRPERRRGGLEDILKDLKTGSLRLSGQFCTIREARTTSVKATEVDCEDQAPWPLGDSPFLRIL